MILRRYEVRMCLTDGTIAAVCRRFFNCDSAAYYAGQKQYTSKHFRVRIFDRKKGKYLS